MTAGGLASWTRANLFRRWYDVVLTGAFATAGALVLGELWSWGVERASFSPRPDACRQSTGACWSVITDMWPLFLAGLYPPDQRWRAFVGLAVLLAGAAAAGFSTAGWRQRLAIWVAAVFAFLVLVRGGLPGLPVVETQRWGGVLLTALLASVSQTLAFPLGVLLALGRRSSRSAMLRAACSTYVEVVRSVPLVMVLLMTTLTMPLFLPPSWPLDTVVTALVGLTLFSAAAIAEVVRGGLNGIGPGQREAALSVGLSRTQVIRLVLLPQALARVQPALLGTFVTFVKGSTLVVAIGLYDLLGAAVLASSNPAWVGHSIEPLVFVGFVFWAVCFSLSRVSARLERRRTGVSAGRRSSSDRRD